MKVLSCMLLTGVLTMFGGRPHSVHLEEQLTGDERKLFTWKGRGKTKSKKPNPLKKGLDKIREKRKAIKAMLEDKASDVSDAVQEQFGEAWQNFRDTPKRVKAAFLLLRQGAQSAVDKADGRWTQFSKKLRDLKTAINTFTKKNEEKVERALKDSIDEAVTKLEVAAEKGGKTVAALSKKVGRGGKQLGDVAAAGAKKGAGGFKSAWAASGKAAKNAMSEALHAAKKWLSDEENMASLLELLEPLLEKAMKAVVDKVADEPLFQALEELADEVEDLEDTKLEVRADLAEAAMDLQDAEGEEAPAKPEANEPEEEETPTPAPTAPTPAPTPLPCTWKKGTYVTGSKRVVLVCRGCTNEECVAQGSDLYPEAFEAQKDYCLALYGYTKGKFVTPPGHTTNTCVVVW